MIPYILCFASSCFLFWLVQKSEDYPISKAIFAVLAISIPAGLAAIRSVSIGTDNQYYITPVFMDALSSPSLNGMSPQWDGWIEKGYMALAFGIGRLCRQVPLFHFALLFIECGFVFLALYQWRRQIPVWLGMLCFFTLFYNTSLNASRQCLALGICLFALQYLFKQKLLPFYFFTLLAMLFHSSAILCLAFHPIYFYVNHFQSTKADLILVAAFVVAVVSLFLFVDKYILLFEAFEATSKGVNYLADTSKGTKFPYRSILLFLPIVASFIYRRKEIQDMIPAGIYHFLACMNLMIFAIVAIFPMLNDGFIRRITDQFQWQICFLVPCTVASFPLRGQKIVAITAAVAYLFLHWTFVSVVRNLGETYPYDSSWFNSIF
jgi:hypothetical protein